MQVTADDVVLACAFGAVLTVIASAETHLRERSSGWAERRFTAVVFKSNDGAELVAVSDDIAYHPLFAGDGIDIEQADAADFIAFVGDETMAKQLVESADDEHGHAVFGELA